MLLNRNIKIVISNGTTSYQSGTDFGITAGSMKLDEVLCDSEFSLKQLGASKFEVQCFNLSADVTGWNIVVTCETTSEPISTIPVFSGVIDSASTDNFGDFRDIVAYDRLYTLRDKDVGAWWDTFWSSRPTYTAVALPVGSPADNSYYELSGSTYALSSDTTVNVSKTYYYSVPIATIGDIRTALCNNVGLSYQSITLVNDAIQVKQYLTSANPSVHTQIKFGDLMSMICEINGVIGHINRSGTFEFITLDTTTSTIGDFEKVNAEFQDYETQTITGINVYESSEKLMYAYLDSTNAYKISGNIFTLTLDDYSILGTICSRILPKINTIRYTPCKIPMIVSDLNLQLGNKISTTYGTHYILSQSFSGSLLVDQTIECPAYGDVLRQDVSDINNNIIANQQYSTIMQTQERIQFEVRDTETKITGDLTKISDNVLTVTNTADGLTTSVSNIQTDIDDLSTRVNTQETHVQIAANGVTITQGTKGSYTLFTDSGMEIYVNSKKTAFAEADGFAATELMLGTDTTKWHLQEANGKKTLVFMRR